MIVEIHYQGWCFVPFISFSFAVFFLIFVILYHLAAHLKNGVLLQKLFLLAASLVFYAAADFRFLPFLFYVIAVSYAGGRFCRNKMTFALFVAADVLPLLFFKYSRTSLMFPLGLSFFTFQSISYIADVFTKKIKAERNPLNVALFISFFPTVSSGPIQRAGKLLPQFEHVHTFDYVNATNGLKLFAWGMFKKIVIADRIAVYVSYVFSSRNLGERYGLAFLVASFLYSFQIYCDFSGYTDMARGIARYAGFDVGLNFDRPYLSKSIGEFWRRWHISLSTWLRDYIYIPLGGSRVAPVRIYSNLLITFLVSGMWHGAGLPFIVWGMLHGIFLCIERSCRPLSEKVKFPVWIKVALTFCLVTFAWIFFCSPNLNDAFFVCKKIALIPSEIPHVIELTNSLGIKEMLRTVFALDNSNFGGLRGMAKVLSLVLGLCVVEVATAKKGGLHFVNTLPLAVRWGMYLLFIAFLLYLLSYGSEYSANFIYQNF